MSRTTNPLLLSTLVCLTACAAKPAASPEPQDATVAAADTSPVDTAPCTPLSCPNTTVCTTAGTCGLLFPHKYVFTIQKATLMPYDSNGKPWHAAGVNPDPSVELQLDGKKACETPILKGSLAPEWNTPCDIELKATTDVHFLVRDHAEGKNLIIGDLSIVPGKAQDMESELRNGAALLQDSGFSLFVKITAP